MISAAVRLRVNPARPEAQNLQPYAQPTWEETQIVLRDDCLPLSPTEAGMNTVST